MRPHLIRLRLQRATWVVKAQRVISETPKPGTVLPSGGKVNLVLSRGRKR